MDKKFEPFKFTRRISKKCTSKRYDAEDTEDAIRNFFFK